MSLKSAIQSFAKDNFKEIQKIRRHLHAHPELSYQEHETAKFIASKLDGWGIDYKAGVAKTGLIATIKGKNPEKKTVALRGDMDALPIHEKNDVPYKSKNDGVMHACGHDVHTSCLLGAAKILNETKNEWEGTMRLLFQPSEEKLPGGAKAMVEEGALKNPVPAAIFGEHVYPELEVGKIGIRPGMYMASADEVYLTIKGEGGHAALPQNVIDPVVMAAQVILALQQVVSRNAHPDTPTVLSFGKITGEGATNIIPAEVKLEGTFRTFDEEWRKKAHQRIKETAENICKAYGGSCDVDIVVGYPYLHNDEALTEKAFNWAKEYLGEENVVELPMRMTAEDFALYTHVIPGCFYRLGTGNKEKGITSFIHTPTFDIDERALEIGMGMMAWLGVQALNC